MRERKKMVVHGTLELILVSWKFNSKQLLCKTLNSRMNIIETRAVLNMAIGTLSIDRQIPKKWNPILVYSVFFQSTHTSQDSLMENVCFTYIFANK